MIIFLLFLLLLTGLFGLAFKLTGALLKACIWVFILLPVGLSLWGLGAACCCTLILIPAGLLLFRAGAHVMVPG